MIEYIEHNEFSEAVENMLADTSIVEFNPIREQDIRVLSFVVVRTNADDEEVEPKGSPIVCKKIPPLYALIAKALYMVVCDNYFWNHADEIQQKAALHHALMQINVEKTKKGAIKLGTRKPEVQEFRSTVARYGAYTESLLDFRQAFQNSAKKFVESKIAKA